MKLFVFIILISVVSCPNIFHVSIKIIYQFSFKVFQHTAADHLSEISEQYENYGKLLEAKKIDFAESPEQLNWIKKLENVRAKCHKLISDFNITANEFLAPQQSLKVSLFRDVDLDLQIPNPDIFVEVQKVKLIEVYDTLYELQTDPINPLHDVLFGSTQKEIVNLLAEQKVDFDSGSLLQINSYFDQTIEKLNAFSAKFEDRLVELNRLKESFMKQIYRIQEEIKNVKKMAERTKQSFDDANRRIEEDAIPILRQNYPDLITNFEEFQNDAKVFIDMLKEFFEQFRTLLMTNK